MAEHLHASLGQCSSLPPSVSGSSTAVGWSHGRSGQWGAEPFSAASERVERVHAWAAGGGLWIAEQAGVAVGAMVLGEAPAYVPPASAPEVYVQVLVTVREHAGQGVGRALLGHAHGEAVRQEARLLRVDCWAGGDGALVRYYQACGFTPTVRFRVGEWEGQLLEQHLEAAAKS
jgi:GNAT superfamily N-acetyltransferase